MSFTENKKNTDMLYVEQKRHHSHAFFVGVDSMCSSVKVLDDINKDSSAPIGEVPEGQRGVILSLSLRRGQGEVSTHNKRRCVW